MRDQSTFKINFFPTTSLLFFGIFGLQLISEVKAHDLHRIPILKHVHFLQSTLNPSLLQLGSAYSFLNDSKLSFYAEMDGAPNGCFYLSKKFEPRYNIQWSSPLTRNSFLQANYGTGGKQWTEISLGVYWNLSAHKAKELLRKRGRTIRVKTCSVSNSSNYSPSSELNSAQQSNGFLESRQAESASIHQSNPILSALQAPLNSAELKTDPISLLNDHITDVKDLLGEVEEFSKKAACLQGYEIFKNREEAQCKVVRQLMEELEAAFNKGSAIEAFYELPYLWANLYYLDKVFGSCLEREANLDLSRSEIAKCLDNACEASIQLLSLAINQSTKTSSESAALEANHSVDKSEERRTSKKLFSFATKAIEAWLGELSAEQNEPRSLFLRCYWNLWLEKLKAEGYEDEETLYKGLLRNHLNAYKESEFRKKLDFKYQINEQAGSEQPIEQSPVVFSDLNVELRKLNETSIVQSQKLFEAWNEALRSEKDQIAVIKQWGKKVETETDETIAIIHRYTASRAEILGLSWENIYDAHSSLRNYVMKHLKS